jgi:hypothetical protein
MPCCKKMTGNLFLRMCHMCVMARLWYGTQSFARVYDTLDQCLKKITTTT